MIVIGVDPAFSKKGFWSAKIDSTNKTVEFIRSKDVIEFTDMIKSLVGSDVYVCIENSNLDNVTFKKSKNPGKAARYSRDAGKNQAVSQLAVTHTQALLGKEYVHTISGSSKSKGWKKEGDIFTAIVKSDGYVLLSPARNQDQRDAYIIATMGLRYFNLQTKLKKQS